MNKNSYQEAVRGVTPPPAILGYVAGAIDGEGTIGLWGYKNTAIRSGLSLKAGLQISNTNLVLLEFCQKQLGGTIASCTKPKNKNHKPGYKLTFTPNEIRHVLPMLISHLVIKRRQAELLMEYLRLVEVNSTSNMRTPELLEAYERIRVSLATLNQRGTEDEVEVKKVVIRPYRVPTQTYGERRCLTCEGPYTAKRPQQRYCKRQCARKAETLLSRERKQVYDAARREKILAAK